MIVWLKVKDFHEKLPEPKLLEKRIFPLRSDVARFWYYREALNAEKVRGYLQ